MRLDDATARILHELRGADGASFAELVRVAGLDPSRDLRGADLSGVAFRGSDLTGYDFTDSDLREASFLGAYGMAMIFDRANLEGAIWPPGGVPESRGHVRLSELSLRPHQRETVKAILEALKHRRARALALLPPGVGKTAILAGILLGLQLRKVFRAGAILCGTLVEREHLFHVLNEYGVPTTDDKTVRDHGMIMPGETLVTTAGAYHAARHEGRFTASERLVSMGCSHIALFSLPSSLSANELARLAAEPKAPAIFGFIEVGLNEGGLTSWLTQTGLDSTFDIVYNYNVFHALADRVLTRSKVIDRSHAVSMSNDRAVVPGPADTSALEEVTSDFGRSYAVSMSNERAVVPDPADTSVLEEVASDFRVELNSRPARPALVLAPNVTAAEKIADGLRLLLQRAFERDGRAPEVVVFSTTTGTRPVASIAETDTIAVVTPAFAQNINLHMFGPIGVMALLSDQFATRLTFPPAARGKAGLLIFDYVGALAHLADSQPT